jgi:hypothetical protein
MHFYIFVTLRSIIFLLEDEDAADKAANDGSDQETSTWDAQHQLVLSQLLFGCLCRFLRTGPLGVNSLVQSKDLSTRVEREAHQKESGKATLHLCEHLLLLLKKFKGDSGVLLSLTLCMYWA